MDDAILFFSPDQEKLTNLFEIIQSFEQSSGLCINHSKSEFMGSYLIASLTTSIGCKVGF